MPVAVFAGAAATVFFAFLAVWHWVNERADARVRGLADRLDRAGIRLSSQEIVLTLCAAIAVTWIAAIVVARPSLFLALVLLPVIAALGWFGFAVFVEICVRRRLDAFIVQLEPATRLMAGGLRVGLGMRQALAMVIDELPDPARHEFRRVVGQTNIGASLFDAMDDLAERMPSPESLMMARVFRVQSETGGDLARILDQLAETIKSRRQVQRKTAALTAEGRMSTWVLMAIPVMLGIFIAASQPTMANALLNTLVGRLVLLAVAVLEVAAYVSLKAVMRVEA